MSLDLIAGTRCNLCIVASFGGGLEFAAVYSYINIGTLVVFPPFFSTHVGCTSYMP
jgi:hypothetical protein